MVVAGLESKWTAEMVERWREGWEKEGKEGSMVISFHLFHHISAIWACGTAAFTVMNECANVHVCGEIKYCYVLLLLYREY